MKAKIKLDTRRAKKDGSYPVVVEVTNVTQIRFPTPYASVIENWDNGLFNKKEKDYKRKNVVLGCILNKVERVIVGLEEEGKRISDKKMREEVSSILGSGNTARAKPKFFIDYLDEFVSHKKNEGTKTVYTTTRNKLLEYDSKCTFESMDKKWFEKFEEWMADTMKVNAYAIHLRNIRAVFNYCIDEEYTTLYPFRKFQIKKEETRKRSLTVEQLRILRDYPCEEYQEKYRDLFMLMFYLIGINASDLFLAKKKDVVNGRLEYKRNKTGRLYSIKIEPEAQEIIDRYSGSEEKGYLLNVMDVYSKYKDFLHRMGIGLKRIGEIERKGLGGKKIIQPMFPNLSSYWSRHTWATVAASLDIPKEIIAHALGHSWADGTTTDIYIKFDNRKIDNANRRVIDYVLK